MKLVEGGKPALEAPGVNGNYAFGGARARFSGESPPAAADTHGDFGITITDSPCLSFGVLGGSNCSNPGDYLFSDGIHPTKTIHNAIGDIATDLFNNN